MEIIDNIRLRIKYKIHNYFYKNKKFASEDAFYSYLFTKSPGWSSKDGNEEETIRWGKIEAELIKYKTESSKFSILEIGCGRGWLANKMRKYGDITGIEPVQKVIKFANKLFPEVNFFAGFTSTYRQQFPYKTFDLIISTEVIEHVKDKNSFFKESYQLLKPNGVIIITTPRLEHYQDYVEVSGDDPNQPLEEWVSEDQLRTLFHDNNFSIESNLFFAPIVNNGKEINMTQLWVCKKL